MPVLAAYIGYSGVSTALENEDGTFSFQRFPYTYSQELFSSVCDEKYFYAQVLENIAKESKVKIEDCEVLLTGFINFPVPDLNVKLTMDVQELLSKYEDDFPVLVDESLILTNDKILSQVPVDFINNNEYYANLSIYPQLITRDHDEQVSLDGLIIDKVKKAGIVLTSDKPIVFTGDRFARRDYEPVFKYALALDLFSSPGCYFVKIDKGNAVILSTLIKLYKSSAAGVIDISSVVEDVGTYVLAPGETEVLVSTAADTGQFFDMSRDSVFLVPVDTSLITKMNLKNKCTGNILGVVTGGTLGILFDTRETRGQLIADLKIMNSLMREIDTVVRGI